MFFYLYVYTSHGLLYFRCKRIELTRGETQTVEVVVVIEVVVAVVVVAAAAVVVVVSLLLSLQP